MRREDWWKLYINPSDHQRALAKSPNDPGKLYDLEQSPGYQASMVNAYEAILDRSEDGGRINADEYERMHRLVNQNLPAERQGRWSQGNTHYPLEHDEVAADLADGPNGQPTGERIAGRRLLLPSFSHQARGDPNPISFIFPHNAGGQKTVASGVRENEVKPLVDEIFKRYYQDIEVAKSPPQRLWAIARTVRALHILHPFTDTNGRLNISLLLQRLLLEQGFHPAILPRMSELFNGGYTVNQIVYEITEAEHDLRGSGQGAGRSTSGDAVPDAIPDGCYRSVRTRTPELKKRSVDNTGQSCPPGYERINVTDTKFRDSTVSIGKAVTEQSLHAGLMKATAKSATLAYNQYSNFLAFEVDIHTESATVLETPHDDTHLKKYSCQVEVWKDGDPNTYRAATQGQTTDSHIRPRFEGIRFKGWGDYGYKIKFSYEGGSEGYYSYNSHNGTAHVHTLEASNQTGDGPKLVLADIPKDGPSVDPQPGRPNITIYINQTFDSAPDRAEANNDLSQLIVSSANLGYIPASKTLTLGIIAVSFYNNGGIWNDEWGEKRFYTEVTVSYGGKVIYHPEPNNFSQTDYRFNPRFEGIPFKDWGDYEVAFKIIKKKANPLPDRLDSLVDTDWVTKKFTLRRIS